MQIHSAHISSKLQRLLLLSQKEQWCIEDLDWSQISFEDMPLFFQKHIATVFSHLLYGEQTALLCAQRLQRELTDSTQKDLCNMQIKDEMRHVVFFQKLLYKLEPPYVLRKSLQILMTEIYEAPKIELLLVGMHIIIENIAHTLFQNAQHVIGNVSKSSMWSLQQITTNWIPNHLLIDESRHLAIGHILLQDRLSLIESEQKIRIEHTITRWGNMLYDMVIDPDMLQSIGLVDPKYATQCIKDVNLRLCQLNIDVQIQLPQDL